jgi:hypothetical protein
MSIPMTISIIDSRCRRWKMEEGGWWWRELEPPVYAGFAGSGRGQTSSVPRPNSPTSLFEHAGQRARPKDVINLEPTHPFTFSPTHPGSPSFRPGRLPPSGAAPSGGCRRCGSSRPRREYRYGRPRRTPAPRMQRHCVFHHLMWVLDHGAWKPSRPTPGLLRSV